MTTDPYLDLTSVIEHAEQNGGGTYHVVTLHNYALVSHEFGFYVSESKGIERLPKLYREVLDDFVYTRIVRGTDGYLGLWRDEDGLWSVDVSRWYATQGAATETGIFYGQRAIWDIATAEAVDIVQD